MYCGMPLSRRSDRNTNDNTGYFGGFVVVDDDSGPGTAIFKKFNAIRTAQRIFFHVLAIYFKFLAVSLVCIKKKNNKKIPVKNQGK